MNVLNLNGTRIAATFYIFIKSSIIEIFDNNAEVIAINNNLKPATFNKKMYQFGLLADPTSKYFVNSQLKCNIMNFLMRIH